MLRLFNDDLSGPQRKDAERKAIEHISAILEFVDQSKFPAFSTRRQLSRYAKLWGDPEYAKNLGIIRLKRWDDVQRVASKLVDILDGKA